jgi:predicted transcriptional regulator
VLNLLAFFIYSRVVGLEANMQGVYSDSFAQTFSELLKKFDISCYQISEFTHLNESYLSRLRNGEKTNPSRETVLRIGIALAHCNSEVKLSDIETLFRSISLSIVIRKSQYDIS